MTSGRARGGLLVLGIWISVGLAAPGVTAANADPVSTVPTIDREHFPEFEAIAPNVRFWKRVFSEWGLAQVAVHDLDHPELIYEVVDLPGEAGESYTEEQRQFVEELSERWRERLRVLERKLASRAQLDEADKELALRIATTVGADAVEGAASRVRTQRGLRERFRRGVELSRRYDALLREVFREEGLPEDLAYLPHVESSFQATARSSAGAVGVWQFTRGTGRRFLRINRVIDERLDPVVAARGAARYLREAHDQLGSWPIALTAYNHGVNGMLRAVQAFGADYERIFLEYSGRLFGFASRNFYAEFLAAREVALHAADYFPEGFEPELPLDLERIVLEGAASARGVARAFGVEPDRLVGLNPAWTRRAVSSNLPLPGGTTVWLPAGSLGARAAAGSVASVRVPESGGDYVVRRGDTLSAIARRFGLTLTELRERNGIPPSSSLIRAGQRLRVGPAPDELVHVVARGESLSTIARAYGMSVAHLRALNSMRSGEYLIRVGQRLRLSGTPAEDRVHVVRRGDTLLRIAIRYGVKLADLLWMNRLTEASVIYPGQRIRIPPTAG